MDGDGRERPARIRTATSPGLRHSAAVGHPGRPSPTGTKCPEAMPVPGRAMQVLPHPGRLKRRSFVLPPSSSVLGVCQSARVRSVSRQLSSDLALAGLYIHPGPPNLSALSKRSTALRPARPGPRGARARSFPRRAASSCRRPTGLCTAQPRLCPVLPLEPPAKEPAAGAGPGDAVRGVVQHPQPPNANFLALPTPPAGLLLASGLSGTVR